MFSDPAISALGFQLELHRWEDHWRRMRQYRQDNDVIAALQWQLQDLITRFNRNVDDHNKLREKAIAYEDDCIRRFAQLQARITELEQENADLRAAKEKAEADVIKYAKLSTRLVMSMPSHITKALFANEDTIPDT